MTNSGNKEKIVGVIKTQNEFGMPKFQYSRQEWYRTLLLNSTASYVFLLDFPMIVFAYMHCNYNH